MKYGKKVSKLRENRKAACRKVKNRASSTDSVSGQKCETLAKFTHTSMSADEYQNAKITFLNDFSRVNTKQSFCFILTLQIPYKKCCIQKNHPLEIL
jgi:hypothetical protein